MIRLFRRIYFWFLRNTKKEKQVIADNNRQVINKWEMDDLSDSIAAGITAFVYETHRKLGVMRDKDYPRWIMHLQDYYYAAMRQIVLDNFAQFRPKEPNTIEIQLLLNKLHNEEPVYIVFVATFACRSKDTDVFPKLCVTFLGTDQFNLYKAGLSECPPWPEKCTTIYKEVDLRYDFGQVMSQHPYGI